MALAPTVGLLPANMAAAGIDPKQIDIVILSHLQQNFAHLAHDRSLCWHPVSPLEQPKERTYQMKLSRACRERACRFHLAAGDRPTASDLGLTTPQAIRLPEFPAGSVL